LVAFGKGIVPDADRFGKGGAHGGERLRKVALVPGDEIFRHVGDLRAQALGLAAGDVALARHLGKAGAQHLDRRLELVFLLEDAEDARLLVAHAVEGFAEAGLGGEGFRRAGVALGAQGGKPFLERGVERGNTVRRLLLVTGDVEHEGGGGKGEPSRGDDSRRRQAELRGRGEAEVAGTGPALKEDALLGKDVRETAINPARQPTHAPALDYALLPRSFRRGGVLLVRAAAA